MPTQWVAASSAIVIVKPSVRSAPDEEKGAGASSEPPDKLPISPCNDGTAAGERRKDKFWIRMPHLG